MNIIQRTTTILCSLLTLLAVSDLAAQGVELELERSADLKQWERMPINALMITDEGNLQLSTPEDPQFFRLRIARLDPPSGFSFISTGTFTMGSPEDEPGRSAIEGPQHEVTLTGAFYLQQTEATWAQWNEVRGWAMENGYTDLPSGLKGSFGDDRNTDDDPVTMVSWYDVVKWLNANSEKEGLNPVYRTDGAVYRTGESENIACDFDANGYRLPTEAEWEYAARAGTITAFHSGPITYTSWEPVDPNLDQIAWYFDNSDPASDSQTRQVGLKKPNAFGLYDTSGNVDEWCWDWAYRPYTTSAVVDPTGPSSGVQRMARGGSWVSHARHCRSAYRFHAAPDLGYRTVGFRPARTAP